MAEDWPGLDEEERAAAPKPKAPTKKRGEPAGSTATKAEGPSKLLRGLGRVGEPVSPKECRDGLFYSERSFAAIIGSQAFNPFAPRQGEPLTKESFDVAGDQLAHVANHIFPPLRLLLRATPPLVLAGELVRINRQILEETEDGWFGRWRQSRQATQAEQTYPYVVPGFEQAG
jgi:hypothetical protein